MNERKGILEAIVLTAGDVSIFSLPNSTEDLSISQQ